MSAKPNNMKRNTPFFKEAQEAKRVETSSDFSKNLWRRLLSNLIGEETRMTDMRVYLSDDDVPEDMPSEKKLLRVLHILNEQNIPPTPDNVFNGLIVHAEMDEVTAQTTVEVILKNRSEDDSSVTIASLSHFIAEDVKARRNSKSWQVALGVIQGNKGTAEERQEAAMNIVTSAAKSEEAFETGSDLEVTDNFFEWAIERNESFKEGKVQVGPLLPWYGFIGAHGMLQYGADWGDQTLITGGSGLGKSTLVGQIAEYNAYDKEICDVLVILTETNLNKMKARSLARNCYIPYDTVKSGRFDPRDPTLNKRLDGKPAKNSLGWYKDWVRNAACEINYAFAPGSNAYAVTQLMSLYRRKAEARGKGLLVIVDYLYKLNWKLHSSDERVGLAIVSDIIRDAVEIQNNKSPLHLIMMHQENEFGEPYGGQGVKQKSQMHISLQRQRRKEGENFGDLAIANATDAYGRQRFYHRAFDVAHSVSKLVVFKGNDTPGGEVIVQFENAFYRIHSSKAEYDKHIEMSRVSS